MEKITVNPKRVLGKRDVMIYGHFIEHFHRQIYGGIYDPESKFADEDGFRTDVIEALKQILPPVLRWPGGCFVSAYDWKKAVGKNRIAYFDKAWKVEESNQFGTDEFIQFCRKIECEPYICTNAGSGTPEDMSDWVEYCNQEWGEWAAKRRENGFTEPFGVTYWSIGNENYGDWEMGAKTKQEWPNFVLESAKMMKRADPTVKLSAAALADVDWNIGLLKRAGHMLDYLSLHQYWDMINETNDLASYEKAMSYTDAMDNQVVAVEGILAALGLQDKIKLCFDEWNLRGWYHPHQRDGVTKEEYLYPRDKNDDNCAYTMADAVVSACFLNMCNRHCNSIKMANFAPVVNTRGAIFTHPDGIVKRSTYHVFDLFVNQMGDTVIDLWSEQPEVYETDSGNGETKRVAVIDAVATISEETKTISVSLINKHPEQSKEISLILQDNFLQDNISAYSSAVLYTVNGSDKDSFNDIAHPDDISIKQQQIDLSSAEIRCSLEPHSVNILVISK